MFSSETPMNVMEWDVNDVWKLIKDDGWCNLPNPRTRLNYVKMLYDVLDLQLTPDIALASAAMPQAILSISPAGGGKTTWAQVQAIMYKLLYPNPNKPTKKVKGNKILCMVYNKHNVADMQNRHSILVNRLRMANVKGLDIDDEINACTLHSFCDFIWRRYVAKLNAVGFVHIEESQSLAIMKRSVRITAKKMGIAVPDLPLSEALGLYTLCKEVMKPVSEMTDCDKFRNLKQSVDFLEALFKQYESAKRIGRKYDFVDMLVNVADLLERDEVVLKDVQEYYHVIIADEVQDFTPIMWKILKLLVSDGTPLTCIGDEDQCIYHFRGASMNDLLHFQDNFAGGKVYSLLMNRRCKEVILDEAKSVIEENTQRFDKNLVGTKDGGKIEAIPYSTHEGQVFNVIEQLRKYNGDELGQTVCCFREQKCSQLLVDLLEEEEIPFHSIQGVTPFSHELYRHVFDVLNALELPYDRETSVNLYKVLPCSRQAIYQVFGKSLETGKFTGNGEKKHFGAYDYGSAMNTKGFPEAMKRLMEISNEIQTASLSSYIDEILDMLFKYFWKFRKSQRGEDELDSIFEKRVAKFFTSSETYPKFFDSYGKRINLCRRNNELGAGVAISTFHGLKGLEFENVFAMFLDDKIFPNFSLIEDRHYEAETERDLKESETRLWYVTVTRAISNLYLYYFSERPSKYVLDYIDRKNGVYVKPFRTGSDGISGEVQESLESEVGESFDSDFDEDFTDLDVVQESEGSDFDDDFDDLDDFVESDSGQKSIELIENLKTESKEVKVSTETISAFEKAERTGFSAGGSDFLTNLIARL